MPCSAPPPAQARVEADEHDRVVMEAIEAIEVLRSEFTLKLEVQQLRLKQIQERMDEQHENVQAPNFSAARFV
jgi:hypothetical protein